MFAVNYTEEKKDELVSVGSAEHKSMIRLVTFHTITFWVYECVCAWIQALKLLQAKKITLFSCCELT